ncbi:AbiU2 domain-containing protein [Profundibacter sp.]
MSKKVLLSIEQNIFQALAARAYFKMQAEMHAEIAEKIDNTHYTNVYNLLSGALQSNLLLCVTRIWDKAADAHSFPKLQNAIDWGMLEKSLAGDRWEKARKSAISEFQKSVKEFLESEVYRALLVSRAEGVAHSVENSREREKMTEPRGAILGDLYNALDVSIIAFNQVSLALNSSQTAFEFLEEDFSKYTKRYLACIPNLNH